MNGEYVGVLLIFNEGYFYSLILQFDTLYRTYSGIRIAVAAVDSAHSSSYCSDISSFLQKQNKKKRFFFICRLILFVFYRLWIPKDNW